MKTVDTKLNWKFPLKKFVFLRIEKIFLAVLSIFVFFFLLIQLESHWGLAFIFTGGFLLLYVIISIITQTIRTVEEHYQLTPKHLHIVKKTKNRIKKVKIPLEEIIYHKLDKFSLGGCVVTISGRKHPLFFNTKKEIEKFEKLIKKHLHPF